MVIFKYIISYILDFIFGDPQNFPHPVRYIGKLINFLEKIKYPFSKKISGFIILFLVIIVTYIVTISVISINQIFEIILIYTVLATKSLGMEGIKILKLLNNGKIIEARNALSFIVSRDTRSLSEEEIIRGTIETISENISDGIIAPLFYLFLGGVPLAMVYKAISTLDSMIGYKNEKYIDLGFASAKTDDFVNFIPARITAFIIIPFTSLVLLKNPYNVLKSVFKYRYKHDSPNSAHSEAAVAGHIGVRLGGASVYFGKIENKPFIGMAKKGFERKDIFECVKISYLSSIIAFSVGIIIKIIVG